MPAVKFPNIMPTSRSYSPGAYPEAEFRALNGATTTLRYGNQPSDAEMELGFSNITDDRAAQILDLYHLLHTRGDVWLELETVDALAGVSAELRRHMREVDNGLRWRFDGKPTIQSVQPGRSTVNLKLRGYLDSE
jgi:hypothetical protein